MRVTVLYITNVMPNSDIEKQIVLSVPCTHDRYFFLYTFRFTKVGFIYGAFKMHTFWVSEISIQF